MVVKIEKKKICKLWNKIWFNAHDNQSVELKCWKNYFFKLLYFMDVVEFVMWNILCPSVKQSLYNIVISIRGLKIYGLQSQLCLWTSTVFVSIVSSWRSLIRSIKLIQINIVIRKSEGKVVVIFPIAQWTLLSMITHHREHIVQ